MCGDGGGVGDSNGSYSSVVGGGARGGGKGVGEGVDEGVGDQVWALAALVVAAASAAAVAWAARGGDEIDHGDERMPDEAMAVCCGRRCCKWRRRCG